MRVGRNALEHLFQALQILGVNEGANVLGRDRKRPRIDAKDPALALVPRAFAAKQVPIPRSHLAGGERQRAAPLALDEARGGCFQRRGALGDPPLQLLIELLELPGLAIELGEHLDLGAQHVGDDRDRHVVHRAHRVAAQAIHVGEMHRGDEDDRRLLKPRMLPDHGRELEAVELRHAHVDQHDGDLALEQLLERLARRARLDQVLAELLEHHLVAQELGRLVVDQQDVDCILHHVPRA